MAFGVTSQGFVKKRLIDIKTEIETSLRASLGKNINLLSASVFGQLVGIQAERESLLWELAEDIYNSQYPDSASETSLDNVSAIVGVSRLAARATVQKNLHLFGTVGTTIPSGTQVKIPEVSDAVFTTDSAITLVAGVDEVQSITFNAVPTVGNWRIKYLDEYAPLLAFNADNTTIENALNSLLNLDGVVVTGSYAAGLIITFSGNSGKIDHSLLTIEDNTTGKVITVAEVTKGVPQGLVNATCINTGPIPCYAFSLTEIVTPVPGLDRVLNLVDGVIGRNIETDSEFRIRRDQSLQVAGSATVDAIRSELLQVVSVNEAIVFENTSFVTDTNGLPGKSFACYVDGGDEQEIANTIFSAKPAGVLAYGDITKQVEDSQGFQHDISFSRPVDKNIYCEIDVEVDSSFPTNGLTLIQEKIVAYGNGLGIGKSIIVIPDLISVLDAVEGITNASIRIGLAPSPTLGDNITIQPQQISKWSNARTLVSIV